MDQQQQFLKTNPDETETTFHDLPSGASDSETEVTEGGGDTSSTSILEQALQIAEELKQPKEWKLVLKDKSGVMVKYTKLVNPKGTIYRGEKVLEGWTLEAVYAAVRDRENWDDWLDTTRTLKSLDKDTRIYYLALKSPVPTTKPRDFVLLEKTLFTPNSISIISKSIPSFDYPEESGKLRSTMSIMVWDLQRCTSYDGKESTKVTYTFQAKLKGWLQGSLSKKMMAKRPLMIKRVEWYLNNRYGAPNATTASTPAPLPKEEKVERERTLTAKSVTASTSTKSVAIEVPSLIIGENELDTTKSLPEVKDYQSLLNQAQTSYEKLLPLECWKFHSEKDGVKIYTNDVPERSFPAVRGEGTILGWKKEEIWAVISLQSCRYVWDERFEGSEIVEKIGPNSYIAKSLIKGMFPVSGRDLALVTNVTADQNSLLNVGTSIDDEELIPVNPKRIRAHLDLSAWSLKESRNEEGKLVVEVTYMVSTDLKGYIPTAIVKKALPQAPLCIARIQDYLNSHGSPPFIVTPKLTNEGASINKVDYSVESGKWEIEATGTSHVDVHVGSRLVGSGWDLHVKGPATSVTKLNDYVVRIPLTPNLPSIITLEKGSAKLFLNGEKSRFLTVVVQPSVETDLNKLLKVNTGISIGGSEGSPSLSPVPDYLENPHKESINRIKGELAAILAENWTPNGEKNGIKFSLLEAETVYSRGDGTLDGWTAKDLMAVIRNLDCRKVWDDKLALAKRVKNFGPQSALSHFAVKGQFPVSARDFTVLSETYLNSASGAIENVGISVEDPDVPVSSDCVRGSVNLAAWVLKDRADKRQNLPLVDCTFISSVDLKGSVPSKAIKATQTQAPLAIARVRDYLDKYPVPPFFTRNALVLEDETFNPSTGEWSVTLQSLESRLVSGAEISVCDIPVRKGQGYEHGYEVTIEPATLANVVRIHRGLRLIVPGGARLELTIKPNKENRVRVNGVLLGEQTVAKSEEVATLVIRDEIQRRSVVFDDETTIIPEKEVIKKEATEQDEERKKKHERKQTQPNVMVKLIKWQGLSESQVFFIAALVFCSFYLGLLYERYVVGGLLRNW